jgi:hypothetical protein
MCDIRIARRGARGVHGAGSSTFLIQGEDQIFHRRQVVNTCRKAASDHAAGGVEQYV